LAAVGAVVCAFQYSVSAEGYYSFGRSINKSFGDANEETMLTESIFVPIEGTVLDVDLALNVEHPSICDLQIFLESPAGTRVCINSYDVHTPFVAGRKDFYWTIFDAESPVDIDSGTSPFSGLYRGNGPDSLTVFYGQQSYGTWQVTISDKVLGDTGTFKGVRLDFHINPEPSTMLLFLFSAVIGIFSDKPKSV